MIDAAVLQVLEQVPVIQIGVIVLASLLLGIIFARLGQSSSIGYILAGILLGPLAFNYLTPEGVGSDVIYFLGEIGVMLLLFYLGLELNVKKFLESGMVATILAFIEMLFAFIAGFGVAKLFGYSDIEAIVIGTMLTATSTVITSKFILERGLMKDVNARIAISILVLEDFFAILVLVFLSSLASQQSLNSLVFNAVVFVIAMFFIVSRVSKHVLNIMNRLGYGDHMWLYGIGVFLVVAYFGNTFLGLSPALGAYFAGFALAETAYGTKIKDALGAFREFFILFFFVSFGASVVIPTSLILFVFLAAVMAAYLLSKMFAYGIFGTAIGMETRSSVVVGILMLSIGEFSIIIASAAKDLVGRPGEILSLAFLFTIATTTMMPILYSTREIPSRLWEKIYPRRIAERTRILERKLRALDDMARDPILHTELLVTLENVLKHVIIAASIVYLAFLTNTEFSIPFLPFVPEHLAVGAVILPLILWPIYQILTDLTFLVKKASTQIITRAFPAKDENVKEIERQAAAVFTGVILTAAGIAATALLHYKFNADPLFLLFPATFTLIAVMHFSRSFYALVQEFEEIEMGFEGDAMDGDITVKDKRLLSMSREFEGDARRLRMLESESQGVREELHEAMRAEDYKKARQALKQFRRDEAKTVAKLFKYSPPSPRRRAEKQRKEKEKAAKQAGKKKKINR